MTNASDSAAEPYSPDGETRTHFGFKDVAASEKAGLVRQVFDRVAPSYDVMNDVMSFGVHRLWKDAMVSWLDPRPGQRFLDVAGGTGDIAFRILDRIAERQPKSDPQTASTGGTRLTVSDINHDMLVQGRARAGHRAEDALPVPDQWVAADAQTLPLPDASVDAYTIAFGIRNVTDIDRALREAHRVLGWGGRFLCLEFSTPDLPGLESLYDLYSFHVIPRMGQVIARDGDAYQYLVESIRRFPDQRAFAARIEQAGFQSVRVRSLSGGIAALHSGWKV